MPQNLSQVFVRSLHWIMTIFRIHFSNSLSFFKEWGAGGCGWGLPLENRFERFMNACLSRSFFCHFSLITLALSQLRICRPPSSPTLLTFDQPFMDDEECVIYYRKNNKKILRFLFSELLWKFHRKLTVLRTKMTKNEHNSKIKIGNLKLDFSFYSADCSSFM